MLLTGCGPEQTVAPFSVAMAPTSDNIVQIVKFYTRGPWLQFRQDGGPRPDGFKVSALYLIDGQTDRGAFGAGTIAVNLYVVERDEQGDDVATKIYEWEYDAQKAMPFRAKKRTLQGWGYQLRLNWGDLDLSGKEIEIEILYRRLDGQTVNSAPKRLKVPRLGVRRKVIRRSVPPATQPMRDSSTSP